jgi:hypothetical protein
MISFAIVPSKTSKQRNKYFSLRDKRRNIFIVIHADLFTEYFHSKRKSWISFKYVNYKNTLRRAIFSRKMLF